MSDANPSESPQQAGEAPAATAAAATQDEKLWAMLSHLSGLLVFVTGFGQIIAPLVIYLLHKDKSKFIAFHALQCLYFHLVMLGVYAVGIVVAICTFGIGALLFAPIGIGAAVYNVIAGIKANQGEWFEYWLVGKWARGQS